MSAPPASPSHLHYAPPPAGHRRRRWGRRAALPVVVVTLALLGVRWGPAVSRQARLLYWQRQCLRYEARPRGRVVCAEPLPYGGVTPPFTLAAADPDCLAGLRPFVAGDWPPPAAAGPVVFLHERRTPGGARRLVVLRRTPPGQRQSWDAPLSFTATVVVPAGLRGDPVAQTMLLPDPLPSAFGDGTPAGPSVRLFAGRADPDDESHFTIDYDLDGRPGVIQGWLRDRPAADGGSPEVVVELKPG